MTSIPKPKQPRFLQAVQWVLDPVGYMHSNFRRYGDIFQTGLSWGSSNSFVMVSEPKAVQYLLTHDTGPEFSAPGEVNERLAPFFGRQNLMLFSGAEHQRRRQLVMPAFHGDHLPIYGHLIHKICSTAIAQWPLHQPLNVRSLMADITREIILQVIFGQHQGERYAQLEQLIRIILERTSAPSAAAIILFPWLQNDFGSWSPGHRLLQVIAKIDKLVFAEIQERRATPDPDRTDILSLLMMAQDQDGKSLSDQALRDELLTLLVAGHDTTATALTWAIYWIYSLPNVKQHLLNVLETVSDPTTPAEFLKLPYLTAVCNETLRIYPVTLSTFLRRVEVPIELCGYHLELGMMVTGCIYLIHQREDLYPQPKQFRPERFLEKSFSPYEFMPFGGGARRCVGATLALSEMKIILGTILKQVELVLLNQQPVQPGRRAVNLGPKIPIRVKKIGS
ncbi:cytochrome P450 [Acaryochloris sp. IP29b_bin.137]|uniref:cytochrome P450 n=1 Tax=Acaryochloris sp. IP29b_bin.137 TaxID=2969217 RepID=UPI00262982CD|nr:cytochrome P450 [Acaryochloris sp. IP29b_bin.137]